MGLVARARALHDHRRILVLLVRRDLKVRYAGSVLGYVWTVLDPMMMTGVYWFVFSVVFHRRGVGEQPYILFLVLGLLSWQWTSATITESAKALTTEAKLVRSTRLPREIWVLKVVGSKGLEFLFSLPIVALFMAIYGKVPTWHVVLLPLAVVIQAILLTGLGLALASATVLVRDLQRVIRIALRVGFYLSPILYSVRNVPHGVLRELFALNPMTGIIELYRAMAFSGSSAGWHVVAAAAVISLLTLWWGSAVFGRLEHAVLKEL
jgi:ABC-2 type transport system permease protein